MNPSYFLRVLVIKQVSMSFLFLEYILGISHDSIFQVAIRRLFLDLFSHISITVDQSNSEA